MLMKSKVVFKNQLNINIWRSHETSSSVWPWKSMIMKEKNPNMYLLSVFFSYQVHINSLFIIITEKRNIVMRFNRRLK